jgi:hypothetical protein
LAKTIFLPQKDQKKGSLKKREFYSLARATTFRRDVSKFNKPHQKRCRELAHKTMPFLADGVASGGYLLFGVFAASEHLGSKDWSNLHQSL